MREPITALVWLELWSLSATQGLRPEAFAFKAASLSAPHQPFPVPAVALVIAD